MSKKIKYHVRDGFEVVEGLYAFWSYDLFPFCCGGTVMAMDADGRAQIVEYQGGIVTPIKVLPLAAGKKLQEHIDQLRRDQIAELGQFNARWLERVRRHLPVKR